MLLPQCGFRQSGHAVHQSESRRVDSARCAGDVDDGERPATTRIDPVNLTVAAAALVAGIGNLTLTIGSVELGGIAWGSI